LTALRDRVLSCLSRTSERWHDGLAVELAADRWADLKRIGFNSSNYGTARILRSDPSAPREGFAVMTAGMDRPVPLERFETTMLARYGSLGLREPKSFDARHFESEFAEALGLIDSAPGASAAVRELVWSVTPIEVDGPEFDTSYSDPDVPFSIFIGAHRPADRVPAIRLAEGILHEAMHLQLSLMEDEVPLITGHSDRRRSPWQGRQRPTQGLLHGLYVFRVVQDWLLAVVAAGAVEGAEREYVGLRLKQINADCAKLVGIDESVDLTSNGRLFAEALLR
jgi:HEXXH motif-containing protein